MRFAKCWKKSGTRMTNLKSPSPAASSNISGNSVSLRHPLKWVSWLIGIYGNRRKGEKSHFAPNNAQRL